jgi:hypothetical protein
MCYIRKLVAVLHGDEPMNFETCRTFTFFSIIVNKLFRFPCTFIHLQFYLFLSSSFVNRTSLSKREGAEWNAEVLFPGSCLSGDVLFRATSLLSDVRSKAGFCCNGDRIFKLTSDLEIVASF